MHNARYTVGIDLGTTNSAVAFVDTASEFVTGDPIRPFIIPQLVGPGAVEGKTLLPSSMYFPAGVELPPNSTGVPWDKNREHVVGLLARSLGARGPVRLVHSAKSWLCHPDVDRRGPILPWAAPPDVPHLSPVQASAEYLDHIREAWNHVSGRKPEDRLEQQDVYLTVPASFDAVARVLTMEAAKEAGLQHVTLLEEPQAAFYCWLAANRGASGGIMEPGRVILVLDIGGGTTDFTLIVVRKGTDGKPEPVRVAVGDHLLLGGDNMDLALAHHLEPRLAGKRKLPAWEWSALTHACREAKEELLRRAKTESVTVSVLGGSTSVVGGTMSTRLSRDELVDVIVNGFFPMCLPHDMPAARQAGLQELGLPYAADAGVSRHLAQFLRDSAQAVAEVAGSHHNPVARPDAILFNGGVFRSDLLQERVLTVLRSWFPDAADWSLEKVANASPDLAVARGAAYYGLVQRGQGVRIAGGAARAYYVGLGDAGLGQVSKVLCVVPRGMEEGVRVAVPGPALSLTLGQAVRFPLYSSSIRLKDKVGDVLDRESRGLVALPALRTVVEGEGVNTNQVQVDLASRLTETGTLELVCRTGDAKEWLLELELRSMQAKQVAVEEVSATGQRSPERLGKAQDLIRAVYSPTARAGSGLPKDPAGLRKRLDEVLEAQRERWIPRTLRTLFDACLEVASGRNASPVHEARWLNMTGFCIRPGLGFPQDEARIERLWALFKQEIKYKREEENHREWWILWRRASGGLSGDRQEVLFEAVGKHLLPSGPKSRQAPPEAERPGVLQEMWRLAAALERIDPALKVRLGEALLGVVSPSASTPYAFGALARIGARWPLSGSVGHVVDTATVQKWILRLSKLLRAHGEKVSFALAHLARRTGDRNRDLDEGLRRDLIKQLKDMNAPERHRQLIGEVVQLADAERGSLMGDSIPPGLKLI